MQKGDGDMTEYTQKKDKGALFKNEKKESETHSDYKGNANIDGIEYWLSAWINTSAKDQKKYLSLSFTKKQDKLTEEV